MVCGVASTVLPFSQAHRCFMIGEECVDLTYAYDEMPAAILLRKHYTHGDATWDN